MTKPIQLASGRKVHLWSLNLASTYAGLLEGSPDALMNASIIKRARTRMDLVWGSRHTLVIEPKVESFDHGDERRPRLPPCLYTAWLVSDPMDCRYCGSELVVVWFGPLKIGMSLRRMIEDGVKDVQWEANAWNFNF